ncbi:MAG: exodeoxyribonuclease 7 large subunit [bacterium]|nr:MAG: exodeoxyribonuclease 7 large subunit [bacterium]
MNQQLFSNAPPEQKIYSVSEITSLIKSNLENAFPSIWIEGELSRVTDHTSGHMYLTLKENKDVLDATMWRSARVRLKFTPEVGMQVIVKGRVSVYGPHGKYSVIADAIEPAGIGALQIKFEQLKKKLAAKGYFAHERKKPIPEYPRIIGVVTSQVGAAFRDIARILKRRDPGVKIIIAPVMVEGEPAIEQIARAVDDFNRYGKIDVMIVGRGGGSPESLWAFNEEPVADAIYRSKIPVISAVGHEIDFTIADFAADLRASTPSAAAELAVKNRSDTSKSVESLYARIVSVITGILRDQRNVVSDLIKRPVFADPTRFMEQSRRRVDENFARMENLVKRNRVEILYRLRSLLKHLRVLKPTNLIMQKKWDVENHRKLLLVGFMAVLNEKRRRLATAGGKLDALSPLKVLERGYSIVQKPDGAVITDDSQIKVGEVVKVTLRKGGLTTRVEGKNLNEQRR